MINSDFFAETGAELHLLLQWWTDRMTDHRNGGFYGRMDGNGLLHPEAEKGAVLNARILWTFSAAARKTGRPLYREMANRAYHYLAAHFLDKKNGGVFWALDYLGKPLHTKKQVYAQAFAIYGLSEYYRLSGDPISLETALSIFELLENKTLDQQQNGYFEAYSCEWRLLDDLRLSDKDANEAKTQNTHLHLLEAYSNLLRALQASTGHAANVEQVSRQLENLVRLFMEKFIDPETAHLHLFFDENWNLKSDMVSFGHDIEASWLLWDAVQTIGDPGLLETVKPVCLRIADATLREAVEPDGAVINERNNTDGRLDTDRIWWVQAEAIVGFWNAWKLSGDERFRKAALACWQFTRDTLRDPEGGEWFWRVARNGENYPEEDKAGFWKCPYHNGRAMLCLLQ